MFFEKLDRERVLRWLTAIVLLVVLIGGAMPLWASGGLVKVGVAMTAGLPELRKLEADLGKVDYVKRYLNLLSVPVAQIAERYKRDVTRQLDAGYGVDLVITLHGASLRDVLNGKFDAKFAQIAKAAKADGREVTFVILHESNAGAYSWSKQAVKSPQKFVRAWRQIVDIVRANGASNVKFDLNFNRVSKYRKGQNAPQSRVADFAQFYPGDKYVDAVSISGFNRCGLSKWHTKWLSFEQVFAVAYQEVVKIAPNKPIKIAETSTTGLCGGDKVKWFAQIAPTIKSEFPRIKAVTLFLETVPTGKASNDIPIHWEPQNAKQWKVLRDSVHKLRKTKEGGVSSLKYPWTIRANVVAVDEKSNTAINSVTGKQFGSPGSILGLYLSQGVRFPNSVGIFAYSNIRLSTNENRWWDNRVAIGARAEYCWDRPSFASWGGTCAFVRAQFAHYTVPVPSRLDDWIVPSYGIGFSTNIGGSDKWW